MFIIAGLLTVGLFIAGGIVTPFNTYAAIGLYISSPFPVIIYKVVKGDTSSEGDTVVDVPKEESTGDPLPPV